MRSKPAILGLIFSGLKKELSYFFDELAKLEQAFFDVEKQHSGILEMVHPQQRESAKNLLHYVAFRSMDVRTLQDELHERGLSSLASSESHILGQVQSILQLLGKNDKDDTINSGSYSFGKNTIQQHSHQLFSSGSNSLPFLMVTFDNTFMTDVPYIEALLKAGMDVARINCAHDDEATWLLMIQNIKTAADNAGKHCKIYMDLAGPKIRTELLGKGSTKGRVILEEGDRFYLAEKTAVFDPKAVVIGCGYPGLIAQLKTDETVLFDDGEIEATILKNENGLATLKVDRNSKKKKNLKAEKGINFPDSQIDVEPLTAFDKACLPFICRHADLIGYSFVKEPADVAALQLEMSKYDRRPHLILKIETPDAVVNLPSLLLQAMQDEVFGVMIARGDLAVEVGFERMSEVQDEILWFCEAAHAPVIWATQVLENLHKTGMATRSEMTDAAHASMAECVMINKGDFTLQVIDTLHNVLHRNKGHHYKKRYRLRPLSIAQNTMTQPGNWGVVAPLQQQEMIMKQHDESVG